MHGKVVHAHRGDRARYQPMQSRLSVSSEPAAVLEGFLSVANFQTIYIADLDAIQGRAQQLGQLAELKTRFPHVNLWVDAGIADHVMLDEFLGHRIGQPVLGSESLNDLSLLQIGAANQNQPVLSLDYSNEQLIGPPTLLEQPELWPRRIITMTLDRVGAAVGPDFVRLSHLHALKPDAQIYAAGGVSQVNDLQRLKRRGAAGALVATAIHAGRLGAAELSDYC